MNKEELLLQKRLVELSRIAYTREIVTFSEFLNLNELNILHTTPKNMLLSQYKTYGGYGLSERQMAAFLPDALYYDYQYPIQILSLIHILAGRIICCGVGGLIGFQSFINIGVASKLLPNTGVPLPFVSYGLTSLVSLYVGIGFVLNVGLQPKKYQ